MALAVYLLSFKISFLFSIPIGMAIYGILYFLAGGYSRETLQDIISKIRIKNSDTNTKL